MGYNAGTTLMIGVRRAFDNAATIGRSSPRETGGVGRIQSTSPPSRTATNGRGFVFILVERMQPLRVLALGDTNHPELRVSYECLVGSEWVELVEQQGEATGVFDLAIVFQARPGSIDSQEIEGLQRRQPLAGFATLLGSWCEGETRTGQPLPRCERLFWYQFEPWWNAVELAWRKGRPTSWQFPPPASGDLRSGRLSLVAIDAPDADTAEALADAVDQLGGSAIWLQRGTRRPLSSAPSAGIWVGGQLDDVEQADLAEFRGWLRDTAPLVALLDFPRRDRVEQAHRIGATCVLGKPWRIEELATSIGGVCSADRSA